ncbi:hypothetical protein [Arabidopsis thaliana]|uniref:Uncharacterized protein AT4g35960 n=1 Tax=Arabidopsis thaliana TaxID=3702 RepID=O65633_ARATH|nr:hypothetical protein [Arabidopsis thaliana]CAA21482.1 hypothetical protein [Arabidopsis thaliana]CAB81505.1 hypothetical protein [Arabidopsis thaliana]
MIPRRNKPAITAKVKLDEPSISSYLLGEKPARTLEKENRGRCEFRQSENSMMRKTETDETLVRRIDHESVSINNISRRKKKDFCFLKLRE